MKRKLLFAVLVAILVLFTAGLASASYITAHVSGSTSNYGTFYALPYASLTLRAEASGGTGPLFYKWFMQDSNGDIVVFQDGMDPTYTIQSVDGQYHYKCFVYDETETGVELNFFTRVNNALQAEAQDGYWVHVAPYGDAVMTVSASCTEGSLHYRWWYDGDVDETSATYVRENVDSKPDYIYCQISDDFGNTTNVTFAVIIDNQLTAADKETNESRWPVDVTAPPDGYAAMEVAASCLAGDLHFQWGRYVSGTTYSAIEGAVSAVYTAGPMTDRGEFRCYVSDDFGNSTYVTYRVEIDNQLRVSLAEGTSWEMTTAPGGDVTMSAVGSCVKGDVHYQWCTYENREYVPIEGATDSTYTLENVTASQTVYCRVTDDYGSEPRQVSVRVVVDNNFQAQALGGPELTAAAGSTPVLTIDASCTAGALHYEWHQANVVPENAASASYTTKPLTAETNFVYCVVSDDYGNSKTIYYSIQLDNAFTAAAVQPSVSVAPNTAAVLEVSASCNDGDIIYRWEMQRYEPYYMSLEIEGATLPTLTTDPVTAYTEYKCSVSDTYGNSKTLTFYVSVDNQLTVTRLGDEMQLLEYGETAALSVEASCLEGSLTYTWYVYDIAAGSTYTVDGAHSASCTTEPVTGRVQYSCEVSDEYGNVSRVTWTLSIDTHLTIAPVGSDTYTIWSGESVTLAVQTTCDDENVTLQWYSCAFTAPKSYYSYTPVSQAVQSAWTVENLTTNLKAYCRATDSYGNSVSQYFTVLLRTSASESDFTWTVSDGGAIVTGYTGTGGAISVPDTLDGYPVTAIGSQAFSNKSSLLQVELPASVRSIGSRAFASCSGLTSVILPEGLESIGESAFIFNSALTAIHLPASLTDISQENPFDGCSGLSQITVADGNTHYRVVNDALLTMDGTRLIVYPATRTGSYTIPEGVTVIGRSAFRSSQLTSVALPDSVTTLKRMAFYSSQLRELHLTRNVQTIEDDALQGNYMTYTVDAENPYYMGIGGHLCSKDGTVLVKYGRGSEATAFTVPSGVQVIGAHAFDNAGKLLSVELPASLTSLEPYAFSYTQITELTLPEGVTSIGSCAFWCCRKLQSIRLPMSLEAIGSQAFGNNDSLTDVYYAGTEEEWEQISIYTNNTSLGNAQMHFEAGAEAVAEGTCGTGLTWVLDSNGRLTISGTGSISDYSMNGTPWADYFRDIQKLVIEEGVTGIGNYSFFSCRNLTSAVIPEGIAGIGAWAFNGTGLTTVSIPASVSSIGDMAFNSNYSLTEIQVAAGNEHYQDIDGVLFNADATQLITYPAGREGAYEIPGTVTDIAYLAFGWCKKLTAVVLPASVAQIEGHAFQQCSLIEEIVIPEGVQELGEFTFSGCTRLAGIHIPNSVTAFGQSLFANCSSLVIRSRRNAPARAYAEANGLAWSPILQNVLTLPEDLTVIESEAFTGIPQTDAVRIGSNVTTIANDAFDADMVFLAAPGTPAALWAEQHGFLVIPEE